MDSARRLNCLLVTPRYLPPYFNTTYLTDEEYNSLTFAALRPKLPETLCAELTGDIKMAEEWMTFYVASLLWKFSKDVIDSQR